MSPTDSSKLICLVCNSNIDSSSCTNIFYVSLPRNGEILANFVSNILNLSTSSLQSSFICLKCFNLFEMLDEAQWTVQNIQSDILKIYQPYNKEKVSTSNQVEGDFLKTEDCDQLKDQNIITPKSNFETCVKSLPTSTNHTLNNLVIPINAQHFEVIECHVKEDKQYELGEFTNKDQNIQNNVVYLKNISYGSAVIETNNFTCISTSIENTVEVSSNINENQLEFEIIKNGIDNKDDNISPENIDLTSQENNPPFTKTSKSNIISKSNEKSSKFTCAICNKKWHNRAQFNAHLKSHSSIRPYMCEKCGQSYKRKTALEIHVSMHNGVSPYRCDHCNKCFTQKGALQRHLPMHTGEMPYQCEICGKRFVHHTSYNMHALSHSKQKAYKCNVCDLSLLSTSHLKRHMRIHTGEKPFSCNICNKSFAERYNLIAHKKIHDPLQASAKQTKKISYKCSQCDINFLNKQDHQEHMKEHETNLSNDKNIDLQNRNLNGADLLETCVNEVWQSLSENR